MCTLKSEKLKPSCIDTLYLHAWPIAFFRNFNWFCFIHHRFDSLRFLIENKLLRFLVSFSCCNYQIVFTHNFNDSIHPHHRYNIEWSINKESKVLIHSFDPINIHCIQVNDFPLLMQHIFLLLRDDYTLSFRIFAVINIKDFAIFNVNEILILVFK